MKPFKSFFKNRYKISEERISICKECELFNRVSSQCNDCGCFMDYKTLLYDAKCPIGKWGPYEEQKENENG